MREHGTVSWCLGSDFIQRRAFFKSMWRYRISGASAREIEVSFRVDEKRRHAKNKKIVSHLFLFTFQTDFDAFDGDLDVDFPLLHRLGFEFVLSTAEQKSS